MLQCIERKRMEQLTYEDGAPVRVGDIVMSYHGPKRVDRIEYDGGGWRLWHEFFRGDANTPTLRRLYIIDEGYMDGPERPVRADDPTAIDQFDNQWLPGDEIVPANVFVMVPSWLADVMDDMNRVDMQHDELVRAIRERTNR